MKRTTLACVMALLLSGANQAQAQLAPAEPQGISGTPGWVFTPAIGLGALWDSNTTLRVTGDPPLQEWVGLVNPRGSLDYTGKLTRFGASYSGSLETYRNLSELTVSSPSPMVDSSHSEGFVWKTRSFTSVEMTYRNGPPVDRR